MYINFLHLLISVFDYPNKKRILNFFKSKLGNNISTLIDVGAHHGETIKLFNAGFIIKLIISFEPSLKNYEILIKKNKNLKNLKMFNIGLGVEKKEIEFTDHFETQSSTITKINRDSKYFKKKNFFLNPLNIKKQMNLIKIQIDRLDNIFDKLGISKVDILKIDTEGYDFNVIKGLGEKIKNVQFIYFEHHFHDMLKKNYTLSDINNYLIQKNFKKVFKAKMKFRKTFEYIYFNRLF